MIMIKRIKQGAAALLLMCVMTVLLHGAASQPSPQRRGSHFPIRLQLQAVNLLSE